MSPKAWHGLRLFACLAACAFEWVPLRLLELVIGHRMADGLLLSCLYSGTVLAVCALVLTPTVKRR